MKKSLFQANKWLLLRRLSQTGVLTLFFSGPWLGVWILKGNLSSSLLLDTVPMTDPLLLLQVLLSRHWPETAAFIGAALVTGFYLLVGGRVYCSWVCPLNIVTDSAGWLGRRLGIKAVAHFSRQTRYWLLAMVLVLPLISGALLWELINPVSLLHRGLIFGMGLGWVVIIGIFLFDLFIMPKGWCGHLCPVGAFYSLLGSAAPLRISTAGRADCNQCMDCFHVCPEPQVITAPLKDSAHYPLVSDAGCTLCGRCLDVCGKEVFSFSLSRYAKQPEEGTP